MIVLIQRDYVFDYINESGRFISIPAASQFDVSRDILQATDLSFLIDSKEGRAIMFDFWLAQESYITALNQWNMRSKLHYEKVQPALSGSTISNDSDVSFQKIEEVLGKQLYGEIVNSTDSCINSLQYAYEKYEDVKDKARIYLVQRFKTDDFTEFNMPETYGLEVRLQPPIEKEINAETHSLGLCMFDILLKFISPTYLLADFLKNRYNRTKVIKRLNIIYLRIAISIGCLAILKPQLFDNVYVIYFVGILCLSRCNEVFVAFLRDALEKIGDENKKSTLRSKDRVSLALKSYVELIFNFGTLYWILPNSYFESTQIDSYIQALYFSGVTITTLGYGDIHPVHWFPQFLTIFEVLSGFTLIVVSFTIYVGRKFR